MNVFWWYKSISTGTGWITTLYVGERPTKQRQAETDEKSESKLCSSYLYVILFLTETPSKLFGDVCQNDILQFCCHLHLKYTSVYKDILTVLSLCIKK